jgi:hypothetical protein
MRERLTHWPDGAQGGWTGVDRAGELTGESPISDVVVRKNLATTCALLPQPQMTNFVL